MKSFSLLLLFLLINQILHSQIQIDLSKNTYKQKTVVGFLHYGDLREIEDDIKVLKPGYWRGSIEFMTANSAIARSSSVSILSKYGIQPIIVLSDLIRERNGNSKVWAKNVSTISSVKEVVQSIYKKFGNSVIYDIWNEPNMTGSWQGNLQEFFEIFKQIYNIIRAMPGGDQAQITGPSIAGYDSNFMNQFLQYCVDNKLKIDIINWHENGNQDNCQPMADRIANMKNVLIPKYPSLGIKSIFLPEIIGNNDKYNPLTALQYLYTIEKSGATAACKACWGSECGNNKLDGILTPQSLTRSIWWTYKFYAESLDYRIPSSSSSKDIFTVSYFDKTKDTVNFLIGNLNKNNGNCVINLSKISSKFNTSKLNYSLESIPNTEGQKLLSSTKLYTKSIRVRNNNARLNLVNIKNNGIYLLKIY